MSMSTVRRRAFKGGTYKYGNWEVTHRVVYYKGTRVASVRPRMNRRGIWLEVRTVEFDFKSDVINKSLQTQAAIRRVTTRIATMITYNGILIEQIEEQYEPKEEL